MRSIRIGSGAGYAGDRVEPAIRLIREGKLGYIGFECLAERTISIAVQQREKNPDEGYNDLLVWRFEQILPALRDTGMSTRVITNMGAANPISAAKKVASMAESMGIKGLRIAAVTGDDVTHMLPSFLGLEAMETGEQLEFYKDKVVSLNAYTGVAGILEALGHGADIIITGRVSDPALFLAPAIYEFGWSMDDCQKLGMGTVAGHLLECAAQVSGGYYADPGYKDVPELWDVGFPIVEINEDGSFIVTKLEGTGGLVSSDTVKEQLVYEIHDPTQYFTPDVVADFSRVKVEDISKNVVRVTGGSGRERTGLLKTSVGYKDGYIGEGEISYGGEGALSRAMLAGEIIEKRLRHMNLPLDEYRIDYIGYNSLYKSGISDKLAGGTNPPEVRLRLAVRTEDKTAAILATNEVEALYLNGPAGGGGATKNVKEIMSVVSVLIDEKLCSPKVAIFEV